VCWRTMNLVICSGRLVDLLLEYLNQGGYDELAI
jgi:hypothetical protein